MTQVTTNKYRCVDCQEIFEEKNIGPELFCPKCGSQLETENILLNEKHTLGNSYISRKIRYLAAIIIILLSLTMLSKCTFFTSETICGKVVELDTSKPITSAHVIAIWDYHSGIIGDNHHVGTANVEYSVTDNEGKFIIKKVRHNQFNPFIYTQYPEITIIKPGFEPSTIDLRSINNILSSYTRKSLIKNVPKHFGEETDATQKWLSSTINLKILKAATEGDNKRLSYLFEHKRIIETYSSGIFRLSNFNGSLTEWQKAYNIKKLFSEEDINLLNKKMPSILIY